MAWTWSRDINERIQQYIACDKATKYSAIHFLNQLKTIEPVVCKLVLGDDALIS